MLKRFGILLIALLMTSLPLVSCMPGGEGIESAKDSLSFGLTTHIGSMDPSFANTAADYTAIRTWNDCLVFLDEEGLPDLDRSVAESWESNEAGDVWTFKIPEGILFHDGKELTSKDIKFTYDRLRDPDVGTSAVSTYEGIDAINTPDDYLVVFELKESNPDFLIDLATHQSMILDADNTDFETNFNGIGPFKVDQYIPEDRLTLTRHEDYWRKDKDGNALPYLEKLDLIMITDAATRVDALRSGEIDILSNLTGEYLEMLEKEEGLQILRGPSNTHYVIRMRADKAPFDDPRVVQALKLGTDYQELAEIAYEGTGITGNGTPIGPAYGEYYYDGFTPKRDIEKAKELLAEAGYGDGLDLELFTESGSKIQRDHASIWQEQMKAIGVNVDVQLTTSEDYYGKWLDLDLGITSWGHRANPYHYLALAYVTGAPWNESHFYDAEIDGMVKELGSEMDHARRVELYHEIQKGMIDRAPIIISGFNECILGCNKNLHGVQPNVVSEVIDFAQAYFEE
ncbi:MAG: ABC transporter substrate-binding protein [Dethiobacteria bacterium]|jgi:peptide/nickel transport system substrate-binding protein